MRRLSVLFTCIACAIINSSCRDLEAEADKLEMEAEAAFHSDHSLTDGDSTLTDRSLQNINDPGLIRLEEKLNRLNFEDSLTRLYQAVGLRKLNLEFKVFRHAMIGYLGLRQEGRLSDKKLLSIIDFTQTSCDKRFYTIDLENHEVLFNSLVSHGRNTGQNEATTFSNRPGSNSSSLGFYVTAETYTGSKGYSLRLDGMDTGYNDNMRRRAVVMHSAPYVNDTWIKTYGRIGRSQGCPALPNEITKEVIDTIKDRTVIFAYYEDDDYLKASNYLDLEKLMSKFDQDRIESDPSHVEIL